MPTSSSARLSAPASTSSAAGGRASSSKHPSASSSNSRRAPSTRSTTGNKHDNGDDDDDASSRPPLSTAEIVEKATLPLHGLSTRDALTVWKAVGLYLGEQLTRRRRVVSVDRFGVVGCNDAGEAVFLHHAAFLRAHRLKENVSRQALKGQPALAASADAMSRVNACEICQEYLQNCGRDVVENVLAHVVAFVGKAAKQGRALRLSVAPLGEWVCSGGAAAFAFTADFQKQMVAGGRNEPAPAEKPAKVTRSPEEMRERGRRGVQDELRGAEPSKLTVEALEDHTTHAGKKTQPSTRVASATSGSKASGGSRRVAWSESEARDDSAPRARAAAHDEPRNGNAKRKPTAAATQQIDEGGVVGRVRAKLLQRCGERGLNALRRVLSPMDTSGDGALSAQELKFGLRDLGVELSARELAQVVAHFDRDGDGVVSLDELLKGLRGPLSASRRALIDRAFDCMDRAHRRGVVTLEDLGDNYDVSQLPRVRAGKKTRAQALHEFLREWETSADHNNGVPRAAFVEYYHNVSACIADDSDFELLMKQTWHVSPPTDSEPESDSDDDNHIATKPPAPAAHRSEEAAVVDQSNSRNDGINNHDGHDEWTYLRSSLLPPRVGVHTQPTLDDVCRRLGVNRVWGDGNETMNARAFANALVKLDRSLHAKDAQHLAQLVAAQCARGDAISLAAVFHVLVGGGGGTGNSGSGPASASSASVPGTAGPQGIVERIRARLLQRLQAQAQGKGEVVVPEFVGFNALQRTLRLLDSNGDRRLSKDELKLGLRKLGVDVNFHELDQLFTCLDADRSGCVDTDEFLVAMRGGDDALTAYPRRLALVHAAFDALDSDRDGTVTLEELSAAYDVSRHADVLAGCVTAEEALRAFAQQWDTLDRDGVVTRREFEAYYANVSAAVDRDDYFELMMRNAWHLSGGVGQCANSSNRRVLVTGADGAQRVHEVTNDLGIRARDGDKIRANLRAQGVDARDVETVGRVQDEQDKRTKPSKASDATGSSGRPWRRAQGEPDAPACTTYKQSPAKMPPRGRTTSTITRGQPEAPPRPGVAVAPSDFFASPATSDDRADERERRQRQRQLRERAALRIQAHFRGFKCRKWADLVRRQVAAAEAQRQQQRREDDEAPRRRGVARAALKSYYGF